MSIWFPYDSPSLSTFKANLSFRISHIYFAEALLHISTTLAIRSKWVAQLFALA